MFGATFQTDDKSSNLVDEVPEEFDLAGRAPERGHAGPAAGRARARHAASSSTASRPSSQALKRPLYDFLNQIFEPTRYHANATLRGFYFTSGTQQGTPIDQLIGALERSFGTVEVRRRAPIRAGARAISSPTSSSKVIIGEAAWVSTDRARRAPRRDPQGLRLCGLILVRCGLAGLWWISYGRNHAPDRRHRGRRGRLHGRPARLVEADHDRRPRPRPRCFKPLDQLRNLPAGYAERDDVRAR